MQVKITPEVKCTILNKAIIAELVKLHKDVDLGKRIPVFDGRRTIYTAGLLPFNSKEFTITLGVDDEWIGITKYLFV